MFADERKNMKDKNPNVLIGSLFILQFT